MRITLGMMAESSLRNIQANQARMQTFQNQITSGSRINTPSDDPIGTAQSIGFQESIDQSAQYVKNIDQGNAWLNATDSTLASVTTDVQRARELSVQAANATLNHTDRVAIQAEVAQLQQSVLDLSHTKLGSYYMFSGTRSDKPGYVLAASSAINPAAYQGNSSDVSREVSPGVSVAVSAKAQATFDPVFAALAQLQIGLASDGNPTSAMANGNSPALSTLQPSAAGTLTINGVAIPVAASRVLGTTGDTAASNTLIGDINASAAGVTASVNGSGELVLTARSTGASSAVAVSATGTSLLKDLGLATANGAVTPDNMTVVAGSDAPIQGALTSLDGALDAVNVTRADVGAKMNRLTTLQTRQEAIGVNLAGLLSQTKDVDMAAAITSFTTAQTVYQASLKSTAQSLQLTLLDFLK